MPNYAVSICRFDRWISTQEYFNIIRTPFVVCHCLARATKRLKYRLSIGLYWRSPGFILPKRHAQISWDINGGRHCIDLSPPRFSGERETVRCTCLSTVCFLSVVLAMSSFGIMTYSILWRFVIYALNKLKMISRTTAWEIWKSRQERRSQPIGQERSREPFRPLHQLALFCHFWGRLVFLGTHLNTWRCDTINMWTVH